MILDDGGDATMLVHHGLRAERGDVAFLDKPASEEEEVFFALIKKLLKEKPKGYFAEIAKTSKASPRRPPRACIASIRWRRTASCCSGHQRQRQRHQVEVRQPLWLP